MHHRAVRISVRLFSAGILHGRLVFLVATRAMRCCRRSAKAPPRVKPDVPMPALKIGPEAPKWCPPSCRCASAVPAASGSLWSTRTNPKLCLLLQASAGRCVAVGDRWLIAGGRPVRCASIAAAPTRDAAALRLV